MPGLGVGLPPRTLEAEAERSAGLRAASAAVFAPSAPPPPLPLSPAAVARVLGVFRVAEPGVEVAAGLGGGERLEVLVVDGVGGTAFDAPSADATPLAADAHAPLPPAAVAGVLAVLAVRSD